MGKKNNEECFTTLIEHQWMRVDDKMLTLNFNKIFKFFVVFSPCKRYATQGRTLNYYGWYTKDTRSKNCLNNTLKYKNISKSIILVGSYKELKSKITEVDIHKEDYTNIKNEKGIFIKSGETSYFMSMFYHIRCALAHGRFTISKHDGETIYYLENGKEYKNGKNEFKVSARLVIYESTLLDYIKKIDKRKKIKNK